jgi:thiamine biosynthesis protein ThiS
MVTVNKKEISFETGMTLFTALEKREYLGFGLLAVYLNGIQIKGKENYQNIQVQDGDMIQVIDFLGGG